MENLAVESTVMLIEAILAWAIERERIAREAGRAAVERGAFKLSDVYVGEAGAYAAMQIHLREIIDAFQGGSVLSIQKLEPGKLDPRD